MRGALTGIRVVEAIDASLVPLAWGINACMTVIGTIASAMLAMSYGFDVAMAVAVAIYVLVAFLFTRVSRA